MMKNINLKEIYRQLFSIRRVEETLLDLFSKGVLRGTIHTCIGQEACAVGVINSLNKELDIVCSNHRGHGHFIAYCDDIEGLILEIMGKREGVCGGYGGSQHLHKKNFFSNGILGGMPPIAVGMGFAEKIKSTGAISVVFMGDGSLAEGNIYEAFNMASLWNIPILFVIENNQYAQSTHYSMEHAGILSERAKPFGIETKIVDGNDVIAVQRVSHETIKQIREKSKPKLLFLETYRLASHSKGDDNRSMSEIELNKTKDPIIIFKNTFNEQILFDEIEKKVNSRIQLFLNLMGL